jgi:hypothetical protein
MKPVDQPEEMLAQVFALARRRYGNAIKGYWFYDGNTCPGCGGHAGIIKVKGKDAMSLNAFIHRKPGVLIGYLLCGSCARQIFQAAQRNPCVEGPLHARIEQTLIEAYQQHLSSLNA